MNPSLQSKIFTWVLKASNFKIRVEKRAIRKIKRSKKGFLPRRLYRSFHVRLQHFQSKEIATFEAKEKTSKNHIIFFHGGAYIFEASSNHWRFAEKIVKRSFCRMTLINYPLAPENTYEDTFSMVAGAYELLIEQHPSSNFILIGDSAGGGLALALTQKLLKENHRKLPVMLVLLSPWLDLSLSNPGIKNLEQSDHILTVKMLKHAAKQYSKGHEMDHYLLSPIKGKLHNIPPTMVFYGTEELFAADCMKFKSMVGTTNKTIVFREYQNMQHDWAIFPMPESEQTIDEICGFIDNN